MQAFCYLTVTAMQKKKNAENGTFSLRKQEASGCRTLRSLWFTMIWVLGFNETLGTRMRNGNMRVVDVCLHHSVSLMDDVVTITPPVG